MCLWDYQSARLLTTFKSCQESGAIQPFVDGDLRDDGLIAVTIGDQGEYRIWDTTTGQCLRTAASKDPTWRALFLPDGSLAGGVRNIILHWQLKFEPGLRVYQVQLSFPESSSEALKKQILLRNRLSEAGRFHQEGFPEKAVGVLRGLQSDPRFAHNDEVLSALADFAKTGQRKKLRECWGHSSYHLGSREGTGGVRSLRFSPDGSILAAGHQDGSIGVYDVQTRQPIAELKRHKGAAVSMIFIEPQSLLSLSQNGDLILWNLAAARGQIIRTGLNPDDGAHLSAVLAEGGQYLIVQGLGGYSRIPIRLDQRAELPEREYRPMAIRATPDPLIPVIMKDTMAGYEFQSAASPDGTMFTSSLGDSRYGRGAHPVFVWQITPGGIQMTHKLLGHTWPVPAMAFSGDQSLLASADLGGNLHIWHLPTSRCHNSIQKQGAQFSAVSFSLDGKVLMAGDTSGSIYVWTIEGEPLLSNQSHRGTVNAVAFSTDGRFAASGGFDNQVRIWEFDWEVHFPHPADWDDSALPYLKIFLARHIPLDPVDRIPRGRPVWKPEDFTELLDTLGCAGYGWLRPEGVRRKLEEMTRENQ
jgi:WD40 repeat protein